MIAPVPQGPEPFRQGIVPGQGLSGLDSGSGNAQGAFGSRQQQSRVSLRPPGRGHNAIVLVRENIVFIYLVERSRFTLVGFSAFSLSRRLLSLLECAIGRDPRGKRG